MNIEETIKEANRAYQLYDFEKAFNLYSLVDKYVCNGHVSYRLGIMYDKGYHLHIDKQKSAELFATASELLEVEAEKGDADAQCDLGYMYANACGKRKNYVLSVRYYEQSAAQGNARAQCNLGYMYDAGKGILSNKETAAKFYKLSADQGYSVAQCNLGHMYQFGYGVPSDLSQTVYYYLQATLMHNARAERYMKSIMSGEAGLSLQRLAYSEWDRMIDKKVQRWPISHNSLSDQCRSNILEIYFIINSISSTTTSTPTVIPRELAIAIVHYIILLWEYQIDPPYKL